MCQVIEKQADTVKGREHCYNYLDKLQITSESALRKRQVRKAITFEISQKLMNLDSPLYSQYKRSSNCGTAIKVLSDGSTQSWYCGKRWCTVCSAIRQAEMIEGYLPALNKMAEPFLVTLTVPAVKAEELKTTVKQMPKVFTLIKDNMRKKGLKLSGLRKTEINFNSEKQTFNPHFHVLVDGAEESSMLVQGWLKRVEGTKSIAQDIRQADADSLKELVKYQSKVVVNSTFNAEATDTIMRALNGVRTFQNFGAVKKARTAFDSDKGAVVTLTDTDKPVQAESEAHVLNVYFWSNGNWISDDGEPLLPNELPENCYHVIGTIRAG